MALISKEQREARARVRRGEEGDTRVVEVQKMSGDEVVPVAITLTKNPANQRPFVRLRSDGQPEGERPARVRKRRTEQEMFVRMEFAEGKTAEDAQAWLSSRQLNGFTVSEQDGKAVAVRGEQPADTTLTTMYVDGVAVSVVAKRSDGNGASLGCPIAVVRYEIDTSIVGDDFANVCKSLEIADAQQTEGVVSVVRKETDAEVQTHTIQIKPGVHAVVARAESMDVPASIYLQVNEAAYGGWGWGMLDFGQYLWNDYYRSSMREAQYALEEVLGNILYYSELPIDMRQRLVVDACLQFAYYANNIMEQLPRDLVLAVRNDINGDSEMHTKVKRSDAPAAAATTTQPADVSSAPAATPAVAGAAEATVTLTRAELDSIVSTAAKQAAEAAVAAVQRSAPAEVKEEATTAPAVAETTQRSDANLEATVAKLADTVERLVQRSEEGVTIVPVRTGEGDAVKRSDAGVFDSLLPVIRR